MSASKKKSKTNKKKNTTNKTNKKAEPKKVENNNTETEKKEEKIVQKPVSKKPKNKRKVEAPKEDKEKKEESTNQKNITNEKKKSKEKIKEVKEEKPEEVKDSKEKEEKTEEAKDSKEKKDNKEEKDNKKEEVKELIKVEEKPEYVNEMLKTKKQKVIAFSCIVAIIVLFLINSTIFALANIKNTNMMTGISIKNIDISKLSIEDSKKKLKEVLDAELLEETKLKYNEYEITLAPSQIEFTYDVDTAINNAFSIGRSGNILKNNYEILCVTLFGKKQDISYSYNEDFLNSFVEDISSKVPGVVINPTYYIEDTNLIINEGTDGISVKKEELKQLILNSILNRNYEEIANDNRSSLQIEIPIQETKSEEINIEKIYSEVKCEPQDAYFELEPYQIYPDKDGIDFNLEEAKEILKEKKNEYTIPLKITKALKSIDDLGKEAFPYLVSSFSTRYDASNINRSTNLVIAANKINGKVLMPGEVFSFNKVVGKRTVEEGYKDAKIYADGGVVDGLAGGICQISSTLYNSVLLANLEIVERKNHSYPTSYISVGRDATVVYGAIDFQFKNSRKYPIKLEAQVANGVAEFKIHGMQEENEYEIKILPVTTASIPYSTQIVQDPNLAPGQQIPVQIGHAGYKVTTYIEKRLNGVVVSKEVLSNDTYSPMRTILHVGPGVPVQ